MEGIDNMINNSVHYRDTFILHFTLEKARISFLCCFLVASVFAILTLREPARGPTVDAFLVFRGPSATRD
jgi:hypothetical protein